MAQFDELFLTKFNKEKLNLFNQKSLKLKITDLKNEISIKKEVITEKEKKNK